MTQRQGSPWAGLWPFGIVVAYFLIGLWGHYINTAMNMKLPQLLHCLHGVGFPTARRSLHPRGCVWVGSGNVDPTVGTLLTNVDTRFPRLTEPGNPGGLDLAPSGFDVLMFALNVPMCVERTNYIGETCLMQLNWNDVGEYLDRTMFVFQVT